MRLWKPEGIRPVLYVAARNADGSRADGKRFNMSYDPAKRVKADEGNERI